jgi:phosphoesterase RecJ-like protein
MAELLYAGIMTDTGSFRYENTTSATHRVVSELLMHGLKVDELYNRLYAGVPVGDLKLFLNAIARVELFKEGRLAVISLRQREPSKFSKDFDLREKIFSFLRAVKGVEVIVIFSEVGGRQTKANFRSQSAFDVARLAAALGGGGHRKASGCTVKGGFAIVRNKIISMIVKGL